MVLHQLKKTRRFPLAGGGATLHPRRKGLSCHPYGVRIPILFLPGVSVGPLGLPSPPSSDPPTAIAVHEDCPLPPQAGEILEVQDVLEI